MSNKSAGESGDVTLRIELARPTDAHVLNKRKVEQKKETGPLIKHFKNDWIDFNHFLSFVLFITNL